MFSELNQFTHDVEEAFHDVEEAFQDVKEHVILSVRNHSYMIAIFLMSLTSAILVFGTIYMWCFHRGHPYHEEDEHYQYPDDGHVRTGDITVTRATPVTPTSAIPRASPTKPKVASASPKGGDTCEPNGEVRKRIPSSTECSVNNNDSPVKSKIPVRRQKSKQSWDLDLNYYFFKYYVKYSSVIFF